MLDPWPAAGAATPPLGDQAKRAHVSFEGARDAEPKSVHASPGKTRFADIQVDATQAGSQGSETTASHLPAGTYGCLGMGWACHLAVPSHLLALKPAWEQSGGRAVSCYAGRLVYQCFLPPACNSTP